MAEDRLSVDEVLTIIENCLGERHDTERTLEDAGLTTEHARTLFRTRVHHRLLDIGWRVAPQEIPADPDTSIREVVDVLQDMAFRPPGDPTTPPPPPRKRR
jgi:hypothetical protein